MSANQLAIEGFWNAKLDAKLRLTLPTSLAAKIPEDEERKFVLTIGYNNNFILRPLSSWEKFYSETVSELDYSNPTERKLRTLYTRGMTELTADANWRLNLPKKFCDQLGVQKEVVIHGFGNLVEIWDQHAYDNAVGSIDEDMVADLEQKRITDKRLAD